jgi:protein TonB
MNYADRINPRKDSRLGLTLVAGLHVILFYALQNGLGHRLVEALQPPMEVTLLEDAAKPRAEKPKPVAPRVEPPKAVQPPATVPPPMVQPLAPPPAATITVAQAPAPAKPVEVAPTGSGKLRVRTDINPIWTPPVDELAQRYPRQARREGTSGHVLLRLTVSPDGTVSHVEVRQATPPRVFDAIAMDYVRRFKFKSGPEEFLVDQPIDFKLDH